MLVQCSCMMNQKSITVNWLENKQASNLNCKSSDIILFLPMTINVNRVQTRKFMLDRLGQTSPRLAEHHDVHRAKFNALHDEQLIHTRTMDS